MTVSQQARSPPSWGQTRGHHFSIPGFYQMAHCPAATYSGSSMTAVAQIMLVCCLKMQ